MPASRVQLLPALLINQIAAGEVVDRPASVVKELLENSLDAGARRVEILLEESGLRRIRIRDDGHGIAPDDLALCLARHATSKIRSLEELEQVESFGFRGEALPAIASVARLQLTSRETGTEQAWQISVSGGESGELAPAAHPAGTTVEVRDLFFNTPARRKFLKGERTELFHVQDVVRAAALARFDVEFRFQSAERSVWRLPPALDAQARHQRVAEILGEGFLENSLYVEHEHLGLRLEGWVGLPNFNRANTAAQHFFVNGRPVRDKTVAHAVRQAFSDVLFKGRHPAFVLYLCLDPASVDVNVHPAKQEVRFREARLVHDFLYRTLYQVLGEYRPSATPIPEPAPRENNEAPAFKPDLPLSSARPAPARGQGALPLREPGADYWAALVAPAIAPAASLVPEQPSGPMPADIGQHALGRAIGQVAGRFILAENDQGLVLVDQHAAHERVLYEELKQQLGTGQSVQALLIPVQLTLSPAQMQVWEAHQSAFRENGFDCSALGPQTLVVRSMPRLLSGRDLGPLFQVFLDDLRELGSSRHTEECIHALLGNIACKAAIKANHPLSLEEMNALLRQVEQTPRAGQCNHGRPTYVQMSLDEMDRLFLRGR
ncbi:DNA mismatch repair endonuclease MutL [Thermithiobacillus plumbiphilus]|uniref:DNA mismatch repair protein MutL n=1 Tax=Thermithiobacillus plumbiphilus TaxID=1729899 RepID=A0ABU9DAQ1_9PROT